MTEWVLPTANTIGQYVRIQLQNRSFLHLAEVEVFGVYSAFKTVGRVSAVHCTHDATMVVVPPTSQARCVARAQYAIARVRSWCPCSHPRVLCSLLHDSVLEDYYLRAIQADADNATVLRQFEAFEHAHSKFGRGSSEVLSGPCRLCRVFRQCEICELYTQTTLSSQFRDEHGALPLRVVGDRKGLQVRISSASFERGGVHPNHSRYGRGCVLGCSGLDRNGRR